MKTIAVKDLRNQLGVKINEEINVYGFAIGRSLISNYYYKSIPVCRLRFYEKGIVEYLDYDCCVIGIFKGVAQFD